MGDGGWGIGDRGETIHNWVFKVRSAVNHRIKNGFSMIGRISCGLSKLLVKIAGERRSREQGEAV
jgi:hypothetical protein